LGCQILQWLKSGIWPLDFAWGIAQVGLGLPRSSWLGLQKIMDGILALPLSFSLGVISSYVETILPVATQHRLPTVCGGTLSAAKRHFMITYTAPATEILQRGASFIDRILRGAKVGDLPVEYPTLKNCYQTAKRGRLTELQCPSNGLVAGVVNSRISDFVCSLS
jgi:hypothetical protein